MPYYSWGEKRTGLYFSESVQDYTSRKNQGVGNRNKIRNIEQTLGQESLIAELDKESLLNGQFKTLTLSKLL